MQKVYPFVLVCSMIATTVAGSCEVSAPQVSLSELHKGCNNDGLSRHPDCVAAMHRFCSQLTFISRPKVSSMLGVSQEHGNGIITMSCVGSNSNDIKINVLRQYHSGCDRTSKSQHRDCLAAIHRFCKKELKNGAAAGISQEVGKDSLLVSCFMSARKESINKDVLKRDHDKCEYPYSDSRQCFSAASRWCRRVGHSGGITQEVEYDIILVACYDAVLTNDIFVHRVLEYYEAESKITNVCSLDFNVDQGELLSRSPDVLQTEYYDNRLSSVPLESTFVVSKSVTESFSFTFSQSVTISASTTVSANIPFFGGVQTTLSTELTTGISLTKMNTKTVSFNTQSAVTVPPGKMIQKEAIVQRAVLDVPWSGKVVNGLGHVTTITGLWRGVNTFNLHVEQTDMK